MKWNLIKSWILKIIDFLKEIFKIDTNKQNLNYQKTNVSNIDLSNVQNGNNNNLSIGEINNHQECNIIYNSNNDFTIDEKTRNFLNIIKDSKAISIEDNYINNEKGECLINNIPKKQSKHILETLIIKKYLKGIHDIEHKKYNPYETPVHIYYEIDPGENFYN